MKCVKCGCETQTGCSQKDCPHAGLYQEVVNQPVTKATKEPKKKEE